MFVLPVSGRTNIRKRACKSHTNKRGHDSKVNCQNAFITHTTKPMTFGKHNTPQKYNLITYILDYMLNSLDPIDPMCLCQTVCM